MAAVTAEAVRAAALRLSFRYGRAVDASPIWEPLPGPQVRAIESEADELFYGGQAGGGKTDLLLGLALTRHRSSIVFRREYRRLRAIVERSRELARAHGRFNEQALIWRLLGRTVEFGAIQLEDDKHNYAGRPHDLVAFDEVTEFNESQYLFVCAWARTTVPGQRVRVVCAGNPPSNVEGEWVIRRWAPWLDETHPDPAEPGELRWFAMLDRGDGRGATDTECNTGESFDWKGERVYPRSRTFIPARLEDNPILERTGYRAMLQAQPEPRRSQLLYGDFGIGLKDDAWQVIPTAWVRAAQERWTRDGRPRRADGEPVPLTMVGVDVAQGGDDRTVLARRYGDWYAELEALPGSATPTADETAELVLKALTEGGTATIDTDFGGSVYGLAAARVGRRAVPFRGNQPTPLVDRSGSMRFANLRAAAYWRLRDWLDPTHGYSVALPPGRELLGELTAARWQMRTNGVLIEPKDKIKERLGRSPDLADACAYATMGGPSETPGELRWGRG